MSMKIYRSIALALLLTIALGAAPAAAFDGELQIQERPLRLEVQKQENVLVDWFTTFSEWLGQIWQRTDGSMDPDG